MDVTNLVLVIVPVLVLGLLLRFAMSNRLGGEPRWSPFRRRVVTPNVPPSDNPTDAFDGDAGLRTDPNLSGLESSIRQNRMHGSGGLFG